MASVAAHYREQAAKTRWFAKAAKDPISRNQFLDLAAEYDALAERAEQRQVGHASPSGMGR